MNIVNKNIISSLAKHVTKLGISTPFSQVDLNVDLRTKLLCLSMVQKNKLFFSNQTNSQTEKDNQQQSSQSNLHVYIKNAKSIELLKSKGITSLFPIQIQTFQAVYEGRDILASDRTGSGKTIAYSLPIIQNFRDSKVFKSGKRQVKFLIMCPTRQLALQVFREVSSLKHGPSDFHVAAVYGGSSIQDQIRQIRNGVDIVVATPGRLMDLLQRKTINFTQLQATCIDQADQMLQKGFKLDIEQIFRTIKSQRQQKTQNLMFSATIPDWVDQISRSILDKNKKKINLINKNQNQTSITVQHMAVECKVKDRVNCIKSLIQAYNSSDQLSTIIFAQTKLQVAQLAMDFGNQAAFLQGDLSQKQREYNLTAFRNGKRKILVATDVASRGLDIENVGLIIQLAPPRNTEPFIHRAGRTGRAGKKGICITLFDRNRNLMDMLRIQNQAKIEFTHIPKPFLEESAEIWEKKLAKVPHTIKQITDADIKNQKIEKMAETLISSHKNIKQLISKQLVALIGEAPLSRSISSQQAGFKTFILQKKDTTQQLNTLQALNFLKSHLSSFKVTNVHAQTSTIIFDIPQQKISQLRQFVQGSQVIQSLYAVRPAFSKDKEMVPLRHLKKTSGYRNQSSSYGDRNRDNFRSSNDRYSGDRHGGDRNGGDRQLGDRQSSDRQGSDRQGERYNNRNNVRVQDLDNLKLFIPSLPFEVEKQHFQEALKELGIESKSIVVKKKSQTNVFAFVQVDQPENYLQLIKSGIVISGKKFRAFKVNENQSGSGNRSSDESRSGMGRDSNQRGNYGNGSGKREYANKQVY